MRAREISSSFRQTVSLIRQNELRLLCEKILNKFGRQLLRGLFFYERSFVFSYECARPLVAGKLSSIATRIATYADIALLEAFGGGKEYKERFCRGHAAIIAEYRGSVIGMEWIDFSGRYTDDSTGCILELPPRCAYTYDGVIAPEHRLKGVWLAITHFLMAEMKSQGIDAVYCIVPSLYRVSFASHQRCNYRLEREIIYINFCGIKLYLERKNGAVGAAWNKYWYFPRPVFTKSESRPVTFTLA